MFDVSSKLIQVQKKKTMYWSQTERETWRESWSLDSLSRGASHPFKSERATGNRSIVSYRAYRTAGLTLKYTVVLKCTVVKWPSAHIPGRWPRTLLALVRERTTAHDPTHAQQAAEEAAQRGHLQTGKNLVRGGARRRRLPPRP